jgi:hypothetical protein
VSDGTVDFCWRALHYGVVGLAILLLILAR